MSHFGKKLLEVKFDNGWDRVFQKEFEQDYFKKLICFLEKEYSQANIYPDVFDIFNCFKYTPFENVKIVILGQDPYHGPGQAHGLSFSVKENTKLPPSLKNIFKELKTDVEFKDTSCGNLTIWAVQGVLLMNTCLTVREGLPNSHKNSGWEIFTGNIISALNLCSKPIVFMLWGNPAKEKKKLLCNPKHLVLEAAHPSPLSVKKFLGCKHFSRANQFLSGNGITPIDWQIA